jgi:hypothetical protein
MIGRPSALYFLSAVRYDTRVDRISCLSMSTPLLVLVFFHLKSRSLTILLRLEQVPLKSMLSLSFTNNLAVVGTVTSVPVQIRSSNPEPANL